MTTFERIGRTRPPPQTHVALVYEPKHDRLLVACDDASHAGTEVWQLASGGGWTRIVTGALPHPSEDLRIAGPPVAWVEPSGEVVVARIASDGLRTFRPDTPEDVTFLAFEFGDAVSWVPEAHAAWIAKSEAPMVIVCADNDAQAYLIRDGAVVAVGGAPYLHAFAAVEDGGIAVGYDIDGTLWAAGGAGFVEVAHEPKLHGLAWYSPLDSIVSLRPAGDGRMVLASWREGEGFVDVEPRIETTTYRSGGRLAVTRDLRVVYYGGQDFEKGGLPTGSALVSAPGGTTMERDDAAGPRIGRHASAITTRSRLVLADPSSLTIWTPDGPTAWREIGTAKSAGGHDDRNVNFAANDDTVFLLDGDGALLAARNGAPFSNLAHPDNGPGPRYSGRVGIAWDSPASRVVVFGDHECNATWVAGRDTGGFLEMRPDHPPPHGASAMVSTDAGAFVLVDGELHRFANGRWSCAAPAVPGHALFWDPARDRLMTAGWDRASRRDALWVIDARGLPHLAAHLPEGKRLATSSSRGATAAVDPEHDRLLVLDDTDMLALPLASLSVAARGLPLADNPMPRRRLAFPPPGWTRPAVHLAPGGVLPIPRLAVRGELRALLPACPRHRRAPRGFRGDRHQRDPMVGRRRRQALGARRRRRLWAPRGGARDRYAEQGAGRRG